MISIGMTNSKISMKIYKKSETVRQRLDTLISFLESDALEPQKDDSTRGKPRGRPCSIWLSLVGFGQYNEYSN